MKPKKFPLTIKRNSQPILVEMEAKQKLINMQTSLVFRSE